MVSDLGSIIRSCDGFEWDDGNRDKNWQTHNVSVKEIEEIFFDNHLVVSGYPKHSAVEARHIALGKTTQGRLLFTVFTIRNKKIRVISARDVHKNRKENELYEKAA